VRSERRGQFGCMRISLKGLGRFVGSTALLVLAACATAPAPASTNETSFSHARGVYWSAEEQLAEHAWVEAIALFEAADELLPLRNEQTRHQVAMRVAHARLLAHQATDDLGYLLDAAQALEEYAQRHEPMPEDRAEELDTMRTIVAARLAQALDESHIVSDPPSRAADPDWVAAEVASSKARPRRSQTSVPMHVDTYLVEVETFGMNVGPAAMPTERLRRVQNTNPPAR
jgi:hypothetical protein